MQTNSSVDTLSWAMACGQNMSALMFLVVGLFQYDTLIFVEQNVVIVHLPISAHPEDSHVKCLAQKNVFSRLAGCVLN